ncbi:MAG: dienelactone hydrolase family protein [Gemmatimonadetes bacterium]|nr:dienelactone hydrolase family protein [Gemmatimonadota bacterium]
MKRQLIVVGALALSACSVQRWQSVSASGADDHLVHMAPADLHFSLPTASALPEKQGIPGLPASDVTAAARLAASPRHGEWVKIAWTPGSADSLMAWVVYPVRRDNAPVVVVVHEIYGLSTWIRGVADQVAAEGFIAVAPDFNSRVRGGPSIVELTRDSAVKLISGVDAAEKNRAIAAAANFAMTLPSALPRYAVIGYCWGGSAVWGHAVNGGVAGYSGGVAFYGSPYTSRGQPATATTPAVAGSVMVDSLAKIRAPVMLLNGSRDARIGAMMPAIDSVMKALKKDYSGSDYDGAIHGFLRAQDDPATGRNADAGTANVAATRDAWPKTVAFLKRHLAR